MTVWKRKDGKYEAKFVFKGEQVWVKGSPWEKKSHAVEAERRKRAELLNRRSSETCASFVERWLVEWERPEESTRRLYAAAVRRFAKEFGPTPLGEVERISARSWALTVPRRVSQVVSTMYEDARNVGLVEINPFANMRLPQIEREAEIKPPSMDEYRALLDACTVLGGYGSEFKAMIQFAAWTGVRQGELFGLQREDIGEDTIHVQRSRKLNGSLGLPKNKSKRVIPFLPPARVLDTFPRLHDSPFVFHSPQGRPLIKGTHAWSWNKVKAAAGVQTRWHDLRHFCATQLLEMGLSHFDVSIQLGHTDNGALVMARYGHPSVDAAKDRLLGAFSTDAGEISRWTHRREAETG